MTFYLAPLFYFSLFFFRLSFVFATERIAIVCCFIAISDSCLEFLHFAF